MLTLASSILVYNGWRIATHAYYYKEAVMKVESVSYRQARKTTRITGIGIIDGKQEFFGARGFTQNVKSQLELETQLPTGCLVPVWYDPTASGIMMQGTYLRILPRDYPLDHATWLAVSQTLRWNSLTLVGVFLFLLEMKQSKKANCDEKIKFRKKTTS